MIALRQRYELRAVAITAIAGTLAAGVGVATGVSPKWGLLGAFGLAFTALAFADLAVGLLVLTPLAFLDNYPTTAAIATAVLAAAWLTAAALRPDMPSLLREHPLISYLLLAFIGWSLLSSTWAEDTAAALGSSAHYLQDVITIPILYAGIRQRRHVTGIAAVFVAVAGCVAAIAVVHPLPDPNAAETARAAGPIGTADQLAAELVVGLTLAVALSAVRLRGAIARIACLVVAVLCVGGIALSLSRGGLIALVVALGAGILTAGRWRRRALAVGTLLVAGAAFYFAAFASLPARERVTNIGGGGSGRIDLWTVGGRMFSAHPLGGIGAGNFKVSSIHYLLHPGLVTRANYIITTPKVAHNSYLEVLAELGIVGGALFIVILAFAVACSLRAARLAQRSGQLELEILARGLFVAQAGMLTAGVFLSINYAQYLWLVIGLGPAVLAVARASASERGAAGAGARSAPV